MLQLRRSWLRWRPEESKVTKRVVADLNPADDMLERVADVLVRHPMFAGRLVDLHTD
jgi:hypothetical protein